MMARTSVGSFQSRGILYRSWATFSPCLSAGIQCGDGGVLGAILARLVAEINTCKRVPYSWWLLDKEDLAPAVCCTRWDVARAGFWIKRISHRPSAIHGGMLPERYGDCIFLYFPKVLQWRAMMSVLVTYPSGSKARTVPGVA